LIPRPVAGLRGASFLPATPGFLIELNQGTTASYPTAHSQIPACGITAPGSSDLLTYALTSIIAALFDIPLSEVCMVDPAFLIRAMFTLRATQIRRPLPHVVGSPTSEHYETI